MYLLDRSTFRRIGNKEERSHANILRKLHRDLEGSVFEHRGWSTGFIVLDGKSLSIRGKDACEHIILDADGVLLARALEMGRESAEVYSYLIDQLKADGVHLNAATTDGLPGLEKMLHGQHLIHQRCHVHLLRDVRTGLQLTTRHRYKRLTPANRQKRVLFRYCHLLLQSTPETYQLRMAHVARCITHNFFLLNSIQLQALRRFLRTAQKRGFWHFHDEEIPTTTNAVENYIGRLQTRLKTMRGFKKFENADRILDALHTELDGEQL